jgi:oligosaccharyl transferase complex subunit OST4
VPSQFIKLLNNSIVEIPQTCTQNQTRNPIHYTVLVHREAWKHNSASHDPLKMITDAQLYSLALFLGSASMLLIVLYHFLEVNSKDEELPVVEESEEKVGAGTRRSTQQQQQQVVRLGGRQSKWNSIGRAPRGWGWLSRWEATEKDIERNRDCSD